MLGSSEKDRQDTETSYKLGNLHISQFGAGSWIPWMPTTLHQMYHEPQESSGSGDIVLS